MKPIIEVKGLWKEYQRGAQKEQYLSLRDQIFKSFKPSAKKDKFNALEDISFDVYPGDSLAIIGENGAGKSTLLKILSKITPPTRGEIVVRGRLASLLEVGTGFHPELTGRENVYLNGSILGLGRAEINKQFDAIVEFSGVGSFLDTPLKHFSSGMQLRLAFAVAAHLEPEILVIDEVLAVGDSAFQKKCISKMSEVSESGRTIIFVSHNLQSIKNLCRNGILLNHGKVLSKGSIDSVIQDYMGSQKDTTGESDLTMVSSRTGEGNIQLSKLILDDQSIDFGMPIKIGIKLRMINRSTKYSDILFRVAIRDLMNTTPLHLSNKFLDIDLDHKDDNMIYRFETENYLKPGQYKLAIAVFSSNILEDWIEDAGRLSVNEGNRYNYSGEIKIQSLVQPEFIFTASN